jgi:ClpX C4-type zinc finger
MWKQHQPEQSSTPECSFCGNHQDQVDHLTAGPGGLAICDDCVALYRTQLEESAGKPGTTKKLILICDSCGTRSPASHHYCFNCGAQLTQEVFSHDC